MATPDHALDPTGPLDGAGAAPVPSAVPSGPGAGAIEARQVGGTDAAAVTALAAILAKYPADQDEIFAYLHEVHGNAFVTQVTKAFEGVNPSARSKELTAAYGVRPRDYVSALDNSNLAERTFRGMLPVVTAFVNGKAVAQKVELTFTEAEIATNFLHEGGFLLMQPNSTEHIDGFQYFGIDTFMDRYAALEPWLHPCVYKDKLKKKKNENERGEIKTSVTDLDMVQGLYASAAMWALHKQMAQTDIDGKIGQKMDDLGDEREMFWSTVYYNTGEDGKKKLDKGGLELAEKKWTKPDDHDTYNRDTQYNSGVRTATYAYMRDVGFEKDGSLRSEEELRRLTGRMEATGDDKVMKRLGPVPATPKSAKTQLTAAEAWLATVPAERAAMEKKLAAAEAEVADAKKSETARLISGFKADEKRDGLRDIDAVETALRARIVELNYVISPPELGGNNDAAGPRSSIEP